MNRLTEDRDNRDNIIISNIYPPVDVEYSQPIQQAISEQENLINIRKQICLQFLRINTLEMQVNKLNIGITELRSTVETIKKKEQPISMCKLMKTLERSIILEFCLFYFMPRVLSASPNNSLDNIKAQVINKAKTLRSFKIINNSMEAVAWNNWRITLNITDDDIDFIQRLQDLKYEIINYGTNIYISEVEEFLNEPDDVYIPGLVAQKRHLVELLSNFLKPSPLDLNLISVASPF